MKNLYFETLNFEGKVRDIDEFVDFGYVPNLLAQTKKLFRKLEEPDTITHFRSINLNVAILKHNRGGFHLRITNYPEKHSKTSWIYYTRVEDRALDIWNRAHEETHAVCHLGLRAELERKVNMPGLSNLYEEDFCDQAGLYVLRKRDIQPHPGCLIPYLDRIRAI